MGALFGENGDEAPRYKTRTVIAHIPIEFARDNCLMNPSQSELGQGLNEKTIKYVQAHFANRDLFVSQLADFLREEDRPDTEPEGQEYDAWSADIATTVDKTFKVKCCVVLCVCVCVCVFVCLFVCLFLCC